MAEITLEYRVGEEQAGQRLDQFLARQNQDLSRTYIQELIGQQRVQVDGQHCKAGQRVKQGQLVTVVLPPPCDLEVKPEKIALDIYYEDSHVIVVNKPRGMVVHPAEGNFSGTLVNALLYHCRDLSGINGVLRPGIVHRLDKDTSGLLVVAKHDQAHVHLAEQLKERRVNRRYLALVHGVLRHRRGSIEAPIGRDPRDRQKMAVVFKNSKPALTHYLVRQFCGQYSYLELRLATGRTHQIRVHMAHIGHPVVGDPKYGPARPHLGLDGQFLHAALLGFVHPATGEYLEFKAPLPEELRAVLQQICDPWDDALLWPLPSAEQFQEQGGNACGHERSHGHAVPQDNAQQ
ncbi:RluA family pseudouridine synthase [Desulfurispora thermophila]|uniref:RluA family pseudouridine synthase n=1 Tax=Desulfurispora thermophila TaxID=265470 RepID=UPI000372B790|nr:RluA family pseudouridine synthase [Desulfurispora thermophila]